MNAVDWMGITLAGLGTIGNVNFRLPIAFSHLGLIASASVKVAGCFEVLDPLGAGVHINNRKNKLFLTNHFVDHDERNELPRSRICSNSLFVFYSIALICLRYVLAIPGVLFFIV